MRSHTALLWGRSLFAFRGIAALAALLFVSLIDVSAQTHPAVERGFRPELVYDFNGFDTVNTSNGNLLASIPIGQSYPVGEGLSYSVTLRYTGNLWNEVLKESTDPNEPPSFLYFKRAGDNAGIGWRIGFGELYEGVTPKPGEYNTAAAKWRYVTADGSEHLFWETLHEPQCIAPTTNNCDPITPGYLYSRDGSYLRLKTVDLDERIVEYPDGQRHHFTLVTGSGWRLDTIYTAASPLDSAGLPTANCVKFATVGTDWKITDSHGREHWIRRSSSGLVGSVELEAIGGTTATYTLVHDHLTIRKPCFDEPDEGAQQQVDILTTLELPVGTGEEWSFDYDLPTTACTDTSGALLFATLPTGGQVGWTYVTRDLENVPSAVGVDRRSMYDSSSPRVELTRKVYGYTSIETHVNVGTVGSPIWRADSRIVEYRTDGYSPVFGLPYTTVPRSGVVPNPDAEGRYLSTETFDCDPTIGTGDPCSTVADRATYVKYEMDEKIGDGCTFYDTCQIERNRRVVSERTLYVSDGGRVFDRNYSRFDGLGHYRQVNTDTIKTPGGAETFESGGIRTTTTEYNPGTGNYTLDSNGERANGFTMPDVNLPWLLETYTETTATEGSATAKRQYCFSASTGLLLRTRIMAGTAPSPTDLLTLYLRDTGSNAGRITRERRYGGDAQSLDTGSNLCSIPVPLINQFRLDSVWQYGTLYTSQFVDENNLGLPFYNAQNTIDQSTGLVTQSRDTTGTGTLYEYDLLGRLRFTRPAGGDTEIVYTPASGSTQAQVEVRELNGSGTTVMGKSQTIFDALGRVSKEKRLLANNTWSTRRYAYDTAGRKTFISEVEGVAEPVNGTTLGNFDPYGRPGTVTAADGTVTTLTYSGVRQTTRTANVRTGGTVASPTYTASTTTETNDAQGRLRSVVEPSGAAGANVTTTYTYDEGSRLTGVQTGVQSRAFNYDARGLLTSEQHPEKGATGNGSVFYSDYDASGQYLKRVDGPSDLRYKYDRAGRLEEIKEGGTGRVLKTFAYATANATTPEGLTDRRKGKLWQAVRHNYFDRFTPGIDITITETYTYAGDGGQVSRRDTVSSDATAFTQTYQYDDRGRPSVIGYPKCTADCTFTSGLSVTNSYTNGFLTAIPGYATAITYHPNGLTAQVTFGNSARWVQTNDPHSMPRPRYINTASTTSNWHSGNYEYDPAGNIRSIGSDDYWYDKVGRLKKGTTLGGTAVQDYTYDTFGNMTSVTTIRNGVTTPRTIASSTTTNRLTTSTYDAAGNVTSLGNDTYEYDALGMARAVYDNATPRTRDWLYIYTPSDERIWSFDVAQNTSFWRVRGLDGKVLTEMINAADTWTAVTSYVYRDGGVLIASHSDQRSYPTRFYAVDHLGTPRQIVSGNSIMALHSYYPFGEEATSSTVDGDFLKFTGHERDFCCGTNTDYVDYMHARYYTPFAGRFLAVDPFIDMNVAPRQPQAWNRYSYVRSNPMRWTDPSGRMIEYDEEFRRRVKSDEEFRKAFEAWKQTKAGAAQWKAMAGDTNTRYVFGVGQVIAMVGVLQEQEVYGQTLPVVSHRDENESGKLDLPVVTMTINADFIKSAFQFVPEGISREIAKTLHHEVAHGLDFGSNTRSARQALDVDRQSREGIEPRMKQFEKELNPILPPPDLH